MLISKLSEGSTPTVQINDIRYHIFQLVMKYLYSGGYSSLDVSKGDVLELMAAASFFQLEGLLRYTESRCSDMIDIDNVVAMYIHAKVRDSLLGLLTINLNKLCVLRSIMPLSYWNFVRAFCSKTWWPF